MRTIQYFLLFLVLFASSVRAQDQTVPAPPVPTPAPQQKFDPPVRLPADLVEFFSGDWAGAGEFANGKHIEADVSFKPDLDNQWLVYRHIDRAPNQYQALGTWGYEYSSRTFVMVVNDNFGGVRLFSTEGWHDGKIVFSKRGTITPKADAVVMPGSFQERFSFERQASHTFKMTYEVSKDGIAWHMGDYLVFKRSDNKT